MGLLEHVFLACSVMIYTWEEVNDLGNIEQVLYDDAKCPSYEAYNCGFLEKLVMLLCETTYRCRWEGNAMLLSYDAPGCTQIRKPGHPSGLSYLEMICTKEGGTRWLSPAVCINRFSLQARSPTRSTHPPSLKGDNKASFVYPVRGV